MLVLNIIVITFLNKILKFFSKPIPLWPMWCFERKKELIGKGNNDLEGYCSIWTKNLIYKRKKTKKKKEREKSKIKEKEPEREKGMKRMKKEEDEREEDFRH